MTDMELKARHVVDVYDNYSEHPCEESSQVYLKSEVDKAIAEKDAEIAELKEKRDTAEKLLNKALNCVSNGKNHMMSLARKKNHADYKRCLAMAKWCRLRGRLFGACGLYEKELWALEWYKRWLGLAERFK